MIDMNLPRIDPELQELVTLNLRIVTRRCAPCVTNQHHTIIFYEEPQSTVDIGDPGILKRDPPHLRADPDGNQLASTRFGRCQLMAAPSRSMREAYLRGFTVLLLCPPRGPMRMILNRV